MGVCYRTLVFRTIYSTKLLSVRDNCLLLIRWHHSVLTKSHQGEVGHGSIPHGHVDHVVRCLGVAARYVDLLGFACDLLDGAHEQVRNYGDSEKAGDEMLVDFS